jgi:hypothetical protein
MANLASMFDPNTQGSSTMSRYEFSALPGTSSVAAAVTLLVSGWFFLAAATMVVTPTDTQVARASSVSVKPLGVVVPVQADTMAIAPEARLTIVVTARRA